MTSAISKRQQARNERTLQDLLKTVLGNDRCADCGAKNPGWASWNLGVFLCMRCGGLHRRLGTHVSKVKSLSMDSWSTEQVENMKKVGNVEGNKRWNPKGVRPDLPVDADEVDSAIERFIRQKYEQRAFTTGGTAPPGPVMRQNTTGSTGTGSWNEEPPPLPPKPGKKFGFSLRSASSVFPRGNKYDRNFTPPLSPAFSGSERSGPQDPPSPPAREIRPSNKPSQMFGMKITSVGNNFGAKLATLRDMGFSDNRRNSDILKSSNGSLDQAIEALVKLGEGSSREPQHMPASRTLTPVSMANQGISGISIDKTRQSEKKAASNPWELVESSMPPQRAATQPLPEPPRSQSAQPVTSHWNPFLSQAQPQQTMIDSFQNLQVSQTGPSTAQQHGQTQGFGPVLAQYQQVNAPQQLANPWETASMPQQQQQGAPNTMYGQQYGQPQMYQHQASAPQPEQTSNPFLQRTASQTLVPSNPWSQQPQQAPPVQRASSPWGQQAQQQQAAPMEQASNPFGVPYSQQVQVQNASQQQPMQSPAPIYGPAEYFAQQQQGLQQTQQQQWQAQQSYQQQQQAEQQQWNVQQSAPNPYQQQQQMAQQTGMPFQQQQQYQQSQLPQQGQQQPWMYHEVNPQPQPQARLDKSSILNLYSMAPQQQQRALQPVMEDGGVQQQQAYQQGQQAQQQGFPQLQQPAFQPQQQQQQRSVTMPVSREVGTSHFNGVPQQGARHVSNDSTAFVGFAGEGRHSPDAFAGLSARYVR